MRIAMLLHKSVEHDSRVRREARALAGAGHDVTVLHLPPTHGELDDELDGFQVRSVTPASRLAAALPRPLRRVLSAGAFAAALRRMRPDAVHAHDAAMLVPGWAGARLTGARLVYDSHELATGVPYRERLWAWLVASIERLLVPRCDAVITVSDGIAARLQELYGLPLRPTVVRNVPDPAETDPDFEAPDLREWLGVPADTPLVLHLGAVARDRGCETLVQAMAGFPEGHLLFLGADDGAYADRLRSTAHVEGVADRVHFRPSVPVSQIRAHAEQASIGVSLLEDTCENHRLALPNKVFEYIAAGVPVLAADLPEMRRLLADRPDARLVDPGDARSVAAGLEKGIEAGRQVADPPAGLEWPEDARRLLGAYRGLAEGAGASGASAVVLVRNAVDHDARIQRQARLLDSIGFETTVIGVSAGDPPGPARIERIAGARVLRLSPGGGPLRRALARRVRSRPPADPGDRSNDALQASAARPDGRPVAPQGLGTRLRRLAVTADYYRRGIAAVRRIRPDLIHANDYNTAWIGLAGKLLCGSRLIYDSHELWPDRNLRPEPRGWLLLCESLFVRAADEVITTSPGYAQVLARRYRIAAPRVIRNLPDWRVETGAGDRRAAGAPTGRTPLAVYFGAITANRGLATALRALALTPGLRMRFVGPQAWGHRAELATLAEELGVADRLELLDPVPPESAAGVLADADLGLALIEPACLSYEMTLPNKLYEYVAAGLPVLAGDVPVLSAEVRAHDLGLVADPRDPAAVARAIEAILEPEALRRHRASARRLAEEARWEHERQHLAQVYAG